MPQETDPKWRAGWNDHVTVQTVALNIAAMRITDEAEMRGFQKAFDAIATVRKPPVHTR